MKFKTKLFIASLILTIGFNSQGVFAQSIDYNNQIEFSDNEIVDDFNSINVISKSKTETPAAVIEKAEVVEEEETSLSDLANILENKRLRYRNVRKPAEKCFREAEESCDTPK